jgi:hypothetical protein
VAQLPAARERLLRAGRPFSGCREEERERRREKREEEVQKKRMTCGSVYN